MTTVREQRNALCKSCFWFRVLQNILECNQSRIKHSFKQYAKSFPADSELIIVKHKELVKNWARQGETEVSESEADKKDSAESNALRYPKVSNYKKYYMIHDNVEWLTDLIEPDGSGSSSDANNSGDESDEDKKPTKDMKRFLWRYLGSFFPL